MTLWHVKIHAMPLLVGRSEALFCSSTQVCSVIGLGRGPTALGGRTFLGQLCRLAPYVLSVIIDTLLGQSVQIEQKAKVEQKNKPNRNFRFPMFRFQFQF